MDLVNSTVDVDGSERDRTRALRTALNTAKAVLNRVTSDRIEAGKLAVAMVEHVEDARRELDTCDKKASPKLIADWLNTHGFPPRRGVEWSRTNLPGTLYRADERIIELAVQECRTKLTERALSADFTRPLDEVHDIEREYLEIVADAIHLGHRLRGEAHRSREKLLEEARIAAANIAEVQRSRKSVSMAARERLWEGRAPIVRKVFERPE